MAENKNVSSSLNSSQNMHWNYYNWCTDYPIGIIIWSVISVASFLLGFPASLWVLYELIQKQKQRSTSDMFILSLSVIDVMFTAQIPMNVFNFMLWRILKLQPILILINSLSLSGRPLFMAGICWDCYMAVVYPIVYKTSAKLVVIKKVIMLTIFFLTAVCGLIVYYLPWMLTTPAIAIPLILALPVITFCNISILQALGKPDPTGKITIHPQKKQALHTISTSFIMTFVVYFPPLIIFSFGKMLSFGEMNILCCLAPYGFIFLSFGCVIMPILYLVRAGKLDIVGTCWKKCTYILS